MKTNLFRLLFISSIFYCFGQLAKCDEGKQVDLEDVQFLVDQLATDPAFPQRYHETYREEYNEKLKMKDAEALEALKKQRRDDSNAIKAEKVRLVDELSSIGEDAIDPMLNKLRETNYANYRYLMACVLGNINTSKSQQVLKDMALGDGIFNGIENEEAARFYAKNLKDKRQSLIFMDKGYGLKTVCLVTIKGLPVDKELLEKLSPYLQAKNAVSLYNYELRKNVASIFAADPNDMFVREKVDAMVKSIETARDLPEANDEYQNSGTTLKDAIYICIVRALSIMKGADDALAEELKKTNGQTRLCVATALAARGHVWIKPVLWQAIENHNLGIPTQLFAVEALGKIGNEKDLPELEILFEQDTLLLVEWEGRKFEMRNGKIVDEKYWEGFNMDEVYNDIERYGRKFYPIRYVAGIAIKTIKKRI